MATDTSRRGRARVSGVVTFCPTLGGCGQPPGSQRTSRHGGGAYREGVRGGGGRAPPPHPPPSLVTRVLVR